MEPQQSTTQPENASRWFGKWDGRYEDCIPPVQKIIEKQIQYGVWKKGHFPGVLISSTDSLWEDVTKIYMAWYTTNLKTYRVKWSGSFYQLLKTRQQDKKVISAPLLKK